MKQKNEEFVPSFLLTFNSSSEDYDFDITMNLTQSFFQHYEPESLNF